MKKFLITVALLLLPTLAFAGHYGEDFKLGIGHKWRWMGDPRELKTEVVVLAQADFCINKPSNIYLITRFDHGLSSDPSVDLVVGVAFKF